VKKKKTLFIILAIVLAVAAGIAFIVYKIASVVPSTQADVAGYGEIRSYISGNGMVAASGSATYFAPSGVKVEQLHFKVGDAVKEGDVIAVFDARDVERQLKSASLNLNNARIDLNLALKSNEDAHQKIKDNEDLRQKYLFELDFLDKFDPEEGQDYNEFKAEAKTLKSKNEALEDSILNEEQLQKYRNMVALRQVEYDQIAELAKEGKADLVAQTGGVITRLDLVEGAAVSAAANMVTIEETDHLKVLVSLSKYDLEYAKVGQKASVKFGRQTYPGEIGRISPKAEPDGTVRAEIDLYDLDDAAREALRIGVEVKTEILTYENSNALIVPVEAVRTDAQGDYCYRLTPIDGGYYRPEKVYVETGHSSELMIELLGNISEGDIVALNASANMEMMPIYSAVLPQPPA